MSLCLVSMAHRQCLKHTEATPTFLSEGTEGAELERQPFSADFRVVCSSDQRGCSGLDEGLQMP